MKTEAELKAAGFTDSGRSRYKTVATGYADDLYAKAVSYGEADKAPNMPREVTHDHVRAGAHSIVKSYGTPQRSRISIFLQIFEYLLTAAAGIGGGNFDKDWGILLFVGAVAIAVVCFVTRSLSDKKT